MVAQLSGGSGEAAGGMIMPPKGSTQRGCPPLGDSLVTFSSGRKSPGCRAERLQVGAGTAVPQKPPGRGAERPLMGRSAEDGAQPLLAWGDGPQPSGERSPVSLRKSRSFIKIYNLFISLLHLCYIMKRTKGNVLQSVQKPLELKAVRR